MPLDYDISESEFKSEVRKFAKKNGWRIYFAKKSNDKGWPDLVLVRGKQIIFAELKRNKGYKTYKEQEEWLNALSEVEDISTYLWFPKDYDSIKMRLS